MKVHRAPSLVHFLSRSVTRIRYRVRATDWADITTFAPMLLPEVTHC